jgi:hypothetical protein
MFLHYWGIGPTQKLAEGLKAALDSQSHGGAHAAGDGGHGTSR